MGIALELTQPPALPCSAAILGMLSGEGAAVSVQSNQGPPAPRGVQGLGNGPFQQLPLEHRATEGTQGTSPCRSWARGAAHEVLQVLGAGPRIHPVLLQTRGCLRLSVVSADKASAPFLPPPQSCSAKSQHQQSPVQDGPIGMLSSFRLPASSGAGNHTRNCWPWPQPCPSSLPATSPVVLRRSSPQSMPSIHELTLELPPLQPHSAALALRTRDTRVSSAGHPAMWHRQGRAESRHEPEPALSLVTHSQGHQAGPGQAGTPCPTQPGLTAAPPHARSHLGLSSFGGAKGQGGFGHSEWRHLCRVHPAGPALSPPHPHFCCPIPGVFHASRKDPGAAEMGEHNKGRRKARKEGRMKGRSGETTAPSPCG